MAINKKESITKEKVKADMYSEEDPSPIVIYTAGMIITFIILLLITLLAFVLYFYRQSN